jgi:hypothetical protein
MKMSEASEIYTIVGALKKAEETMCLRKSWKSANKSQARFLEDFLKVCRKDDVKEIEFEVSNRAEIINEFLQRKGFSIRLQPFPDNTVGFASVLDLIVEWLHIGEKVIIDAKNGGRYNGVRIKKDGVSFYESMIRGYKHIVACIMTKSGDTVSITVPNEPLKGLDLVEMADDIFRNMDVLPGVYDGLRFPMVDLDITNDVGWLKGMSTTNGMSVPAEVTQVVQQIKIKMNEKGARFQSATAMGITLRCATVPPQDLIIREPFLVWVGRFELEKPLMAAFVTEESWKNPGSLT